MVNKKQDRALVIFSGGQDSSICLHWAINKFAKENVELITFAYGQKHDIELDSARKVAFKAGLEFDLIAIPEVLRSVSPLLRNTSKTKLLSESQAKKEGIEKHQNLSGFDPGLQNTFIPGRNILFLCIAANIALAKNCNKIVAGFCQEDYGGYYDCRDEFVKTMQLALNQGIFGHFGGDAFCEQQNGKSTANLEQKESLELLTPLMFLTKKESVDLAKELGEDCLQALAYSHTCYDGQFPPCGECHSCHLRARGFAEAGIIDPLVDRAEALREFEIMMGNK